MKSSKRGGVNNYASHCISIDSPEREPSGEMTVQTQTALRLVFATASQTVDENETEVGRDSNLEALRSWNESLSSGLIDLLHEVRECPDDHFEVKFGTKSTM